MKKYKYLLKNIFLFMISGMFVNLISFLLLPLYTSLLTTEEYAIIDLITVTQQLLFPVLSLCLCEAVLRYLIEKRENDSVIFIGFLSVVSSGVLVIVISPILQRLFSEQINVGYFIAIYFLMAFNQFFASYARALDKVKLMTVSSSLGNVLTIVCNVFFIMILHMQLKGYLLALIFGQLSTLLIYLAVGKVYRDIHFVRINKSILKKMLLYALPLIPNSLFWWINSSLDRYFLRALCSLEIVGLYSVASKIPAIITTMTSVFQQAWNLSAFQEYDSAERDRFYSNVYIVFYLLLLAATIVLILGSKLIGRLMFSKGFYQAWELVPWLLWGTFINGLNSFLGGIFTAKKDTMVLFTTTGAGAIVNCVLNYFMILKFGGKGAAIATCCSYFVVFVVRSLKVRKITDLNFDYRKMFAAQVMILILILCTVNDHQWKAVVLLAALGTIVCLYFRQICGMLRMKNGK